MKGINIDICLAIQNLLISYSISDEEEAMLTSDSDADTSELRDYNLEMWRTEFCPVASSLLHRIESHQSRFEPLEHPT